MRALIQCVSHAEVSIADAITAQIGRGFVVLLGVGAGDTESEVEHLWTKIAKLRVFEDEQGKTNRSLSDIGGEHRQRGNTTLRFQIRIDRDGLARQRTTATQLRDALGATSTLRQRLRFWT